ncbi:MAG: Nif11-like leader peptide family RiPP precursor [Lachnospiraceae bacterium]|nr:Nif11-like leader peptide family RiPP precursor [Lachnospiraceae bacterium]
MNYTDFRKKVAADKEFAKKFEGCKGIGELVAAAAKEGYEFTEDEVKNNTELLPEELEAAAGGQDWIASDGWFVGNGYIITP